MASTRLPGKPLADIHGKPMIVHVMEHAQAAAIGPVAVACADVEIAEAVRTGFPRRWRSWIPMGGMMSW
jgi:3-deoxy-manno-octulosonate cytidylyltransferase (CMP-KDO synthetase)